MKNFIKLINKEAIAKENYGLMTIGKDMLVGQDSLSTFMQYFYLASPYQIHLSSDLQHAFVDVQLKSYDLRKTIAELLKEAIPITITNKREHTGVIVLDIENHSLLVTHLTNKPTNYLDNFNEDTWASNLKTFAFSCLSYYLPEYIVMYVDEENDYVYRFGFPSEGSFDTVNTFLKDKCGLSLNYKNLLIDHYYIH